MRAPTALLACAALLHGCGASGPPGELASLPTLDELPLSSEEGCDCVLRRMCPIVHEVMGSTERRNLSCRWIEEGTVAGCRFESRFDAIPMTKEEPDPPPGAWQADGVTARLLPDGRWCAQDPGWTPPS